MNQVTRVTLALPTNLWEGVKKEIPAGQRSSMVVHAIEIELRHRRQMEQNESLHQFQKYMRDKYGELPSSAEDIQEMREERSGDDW